MPAPRPCPPVSPTTTTRASTGPRRWAGGQPGQPRAGGPWIGMHHHAYPCIANTCSPTVPAPHPPNTCSFPTPTPHGPGATASNRTRVPLLGWGSRARSRDDSGNTCSTSHPHVSVSHPFDPSHQPPSRGTSVRPEGVTASIGPQGAVYGAGTTPGRDHPRGRWQPRRDEQGPNRGRLAPPRPAPSRARAHA